MSILKVDTTLVFLIFLRFYPLVPIIEICLKYFLDKIFQKQPLWFEKSQEVVLKAASAPEDWASFFYPRI